MTTAPASEYTATETLHEGGCATLIRAVRGADHRGDETRLGQVLGLAVAKGLVELHGGSIEARSEGRGRGSEFVVTLPLAA